MTYGEALAWLYGTQLFGIKLGLGSMRRLLGALGLLNSPQPIIHVAGTNGKGSVCAMIESIARAEGYRTGLFTSPHLITFRERIRVDSDMISKANVARGLAAIRELVREWDPHPTFFEIGTALGLLHFRACACELVVLETGMGGRLDATNAVTARASVITPIDFDHQKWLGNTLAQIAAEKAGIIKPGVPVVSAAQPAEAEVVIMQHAAAQCAELRFVSDAFEAAPIALAGAHQKQNAALAVAALEIAQIHIAPEATAQGLASVEWPARFQRWNDRTIIDGAHNPAGARILAHAWSHTFPGERAVIILAVLQDKDAAGIVAALMPIASRFLLPQAMTERAIPPAELAAIIRKVAPAARVEIDPSLAAALNQPNVDTERSLITGSLHFAGEALALLGGNPDDLEDCLQ